MAGSQWAAAFSSLSLDRRLRAASKVERKLLVDAGKHLSALPEPAQPDLQALKDRITPEIDLLASLRSELKHSLENDRRDYKKASQLMRWVVIARGMLDRLILRDRIRSHRKECDQMMHDLGLLACDGQHDAAHAALPEGLRHGLQGSRRDIAALREERTALLAPWNGQAWPEWLANGIRETKELGHHIGSQISRKLFLRTPALGALIAAWWIANTYTSNSLEMIGQKLGFGGRTAISHQTLERMSFWVPIFAAGLASYLTTVLAKQVQKKYAPPDK